MAGEESPAAGEESLRRFGSYELVEEIARGGMGVVWRARQAGLDREVALKMILAGQLATSSQVVRFYTEARAAARLEHAGIVPIYEIGEDEGRHYYTMMLMEGRSLADALRDGPRPSAEGAARVVLAVARAIHFAHQRGVLHRDVKPSNILLDAAGAPRIADFGLARLADNDSGVSRSGPIVGTPAYMAPEQAAGKPGEVTTAADVYGLGAVLYELLTGRPPFQGGTPLETLRQLLETEPESLRARDSGIDRDLEVISLKCLQKEPEKRYATAGELGDDLDRWLRGEPILARPISLLERAVSWARRKRELATALGALLVVLVAALCITLALLWQVRRESEARARALRLEESQRLSFQSLAVAGENPGQALLLALEAAERTPSLSANNALLVSLEACRERRRFLGHEHLVRCTAFSPDGARVVTCSQDQTARIWGVAGDDTTRVLRGHTGTVRTAVFSPDGKEVLTASDDATARIWDAASGRELRRLAGHESPLKSARYSPDGTRVLTVGNGTARLWDAVSGAAIRVVEQHEGGITAGRFSPDGSRFVTGGRDATAKVWDAASGALLATLAGHTQRVIDIGYSADGKRLATASDPEAHVWDASTFQELSVVRGHSQAIYAVALSADGAKLATGSEDFTARIWDARTGKELRVLPHEHKVVSVEISRDDARLLTASYDKAARVWDLESGELVAEMRGHAAPLLRAAFSPDNRLVATSCVDYTARLWTVDPPAPLLFRPGVVTADVATGGISLVEASSGESTARIVDLVSGRETVRLAGHEAGVLVVRFSLDATRVASGSADRTARLWDARTGQSLHVLAGHEDAVIGAELSPDSRLLATLSKDRTVRLWNLAAGTQVATYAWQNSPMQSVAFSPGSDRLAISNEAGWLRLVSVATGETVVFDAEYPIVGADFGPEGRELALAVGTTRVEIRSLADRKLVAALIHPARAHAPRYSPTKRWVATTADDNAVRLWDTTTYEERLAIKRAGMWPWTVHFSADESRVVVSWVVAGIRSSRVAETVIYPLDVLAAARGATFGELTPDERDQFLVGTPEERRTHRERWTGGHIFGAGPAAAR